MTRTRSYVLGNRRRPAPTRTRKERTSRLPNKQRRPNGYRAHPKGQR